MVVCENGQTVIGTAWGRVADPTGWDETNTRAGGWPERKKGLFPARADFRMRLVLVGGGKCNASMRLLEGMCST